MKTRKEKQIKAKATRNDETPPGYALGCHQWNNRRGRLECEAERRRKSVQGWFQWIEC